MNRQSISLQNKISDACKLSEFLCRFASLSKLSDEIHNDLRLALEEIFTNIASHAYTSKGNHEVIIELSVTEKGVSATFTDTGIGFNPLTDAAEYKETDDHCEGGMGICIIRSLTDHQEYNRVGQTNVFTVTKHYT